MRVQPFLLTALSTLAACTASPHVPPALSFWEPDKVYVSSNVEGRLRQKGTCLIVETEQRQRYVPLWPRGTVLDGRTIRMRSQEGKPLAYRIGSRVRLLGEHLLTEHIASVPDAAAAAGTCAARPFLVLGEERRLQNPR